MYKNSLKTFLPVLGLTSTIALMGGVSPSSVSAATLIGNLPSNDGNATLISTTNIKAVSFTVPSGLDYQLDDVILRLKEYNNAGDIPLVQIRDNSDPANPANGNVLATLNNPAPNDGSSDNFTFTPSTPFTFIQNATYFLYVTATGGSYDWNRSNPAVSPTGIATNNGYLFSSNVGTSFNSSSSLTSFQINATAQTPEPTSMIGLIAVGVGLFATKKGKQDHN